MYKRQNVNTFAVATVAGAAVALAAGATVVPVSYTHLQRKKIRST